MPEMLKMEIKKLSPRNRRYLGSKAKLVNKIKEVVSLECSDINVVLDLFAGTGVVGNSFNDMYTSVMFNDVLTSNYFSYIAWFGNENIDVSKIASLITHYNNLVVQEDNYLSINFSDTYFSRENCRKIGFIREDIEQRFLSKIINERERAILITSLLMSSDKIANTVGHYDSYRRNGDLDRKLVLYELDLPQIEINQNNFIFKEDANVLVKRVRADLVYIDPPYNSRQYCDAYHLLENIAEWKKPLVEGEAKKFNRDDRKSRYCLRSAPRAFEELIENINAKYILVSYNNMGNKGASRSNAKISDFEILEALSKKGKVKEFDVEFQQFTTGKSKIDDHKERLFLCIVGDKQNEYDGIEKINGYAKSPLNYTGGKYKLLPQLLEKFPKKINRFYDLFGGGFNVGANVQADQVVYNDIQVQVKRLIQLFFKEKPTIIVQKLNQTIKKYDLSDSVKNGYEHYNCNSNSGLCSFNKDRYYLLRDDYNGIKKASVKKDYLLLALIVFSFNNQIRFNSSGEFNMPVGKRDFNSSVKKNILDFASKIKEKEVSFFSRDFKNIDIDSNAFVYCDPPYLLGTASYNESDGWNTTQEKELLEFLKKLDEKGIKFALSNVIEHKGEINSILSNWVDSNHFNKIYIRSTYNNSNYQIKDKNGVTREVLITNY